MTAAANDLDNGLDTGTATEVGEYQLYKGLDKVFADTQALPTTRAVKNNIGLMILEMDLSLKSFEAGDKTAALQHHEKMLAHSRAVNRETETLTGKSAEAQQEGARNVQPDVRSIMSVLMTTAAIVTGDETLSDERQPWGKTLKAVAGAYRAEKEAQVAQITVAPPGSFLSAAPIVAGGIEKIDMSSTLFATRFFDEQPAAPRETVWTRREYKNLSMILEGIVKETGGAPRREATVALAALKIINNREIDLLARQRGGKPAEDKDARDDVKEFRERLNEYVGKLQKNDFVRDGYKANLKRFAPAASVAAQGLQKTLTGAGMLSKAFRFAITAGAKILAQKALHQALGASHKPEKPHA